MEDPNPIRQLQHLLADPSKLLEKISRIHNALGSIRAPDSVAPTPPADQSQSTVKAPIRRYDRALQTLRDMQTELEERVLPLARATAHTEVEQLREQARRDQLAMSECLAQVDRRMLACLDRIHERERRYAGLAALNQQLVSLNFAREPLPEFTPSQDPVKLIEARLEALRREGKI